MTGAQERSGHCAIDSRVKAGEFHAREKTQRPFLRHLEDIYFAERQILKALPKLAKATKSEELTKAFLTHCDETDGHVQRLQEVLKIIGRRA
jgi:ferritin-like metal-binding protein YciE